MSLSKSCQRLLNLAGDAASNSQLNYKHGAVISKGGKKLVSGYNHDRSYSKGTLCCSFHSEVHAIKRFEAIFLRGKKPRCFLRPLPQDEKV